MPQVGLIQASSTSVELVLGTRLMDRINCVASIDGAGMKPSVDGILTCKMGLPVPEELGCVNGTLVDDDGGGDACDERMGE